MNGMTGTDGESAGFGKDERLLRLKEEVLEANLDLVRKGLVLGTFGNASGIDRASGWVVIKPSGVPYDRMRAKDMAVVDLHGRQVEGTLRSSSDLKTHLVLYRARPEIGGVVHTHSTYATAWAQAQKPIPCLGTTHADYVAGSIPCARLLSDGKIALDYEEETGNQILECLAESAATEMLVVAGHGPFTWGKTPAKAAENALILEELAKLAFLSLQLNPELSPLKRTLMEKHYSRKHGTRAYYGQ